MKLTKLSEAAAGAAGEVQFNSSGFLGSSANLKWDDTNGRVSIGGASSIGRLNIGHIGSAASGIVLQRTDNTPPNASIRWADNSAVYTCAIGTNWNVAGSSLEFITGATSTRLIIDSSGRVNVGAANPTASAQLQVDSTTRGFLPPRMTTTQRDAISTPTAGLVIYNSTTNKLNMYNGSAWEAVTSA